MITLKIADQRSSDFRVVFTMSLCALELKWTLISLLFKSYGFEIRCTSSEKLFESNLWISAPNKTVSIAKNHGKNYMKGRPPLVHHLLRNRLFFGTPGRTNVFCLIFKLSSFLKRDYLNLDSEIKITEICLKLSKIHCFKVGHSKFTSQILEIFLVVNFLIVKHSNNLYDICSVL